MPDTKVSQSHTKIYPIVWFKLFPIRFLGQLAIKIIIKKSIWQYYSFSVINFKNNCQNITAVDSYSQAVKQAIAYSTIDENNN